MKSNKPEFVSLISLMTGLIAALLIYAAAPKPSYSAQGIFLPHLDNTLIPYKGNIQVLMDYPSHYKLIGSVHIEHHKIDNEIFAEQQIFNLATSMTASHGGNAIVVQNFGATLPSGNESELSSYIFNGAAIYEY